MSNNSPMAASCSWISEELLIETQKVWSKVSGHPIDRDEAVEILENVKRFTPSARTPDNRSVAIPPGCAPPEPALSRTTGELGCLNRRSGSGRRPSPLARSGCPHRRSASRPVVRRAP